MNTAPESHHAAIARGLRRAVLTATLLLFALIAAWVVYRGISMPKVVVGAILALPLVLALPRLHAGNRRTYAWMTLAVVPSLVLAITEAVANSAARWWAGLCLFTVFTLFALLIAHLRVTRPIADSSG